MEQAVLSGRGRATASGPNLLKADIRDVLELGAGLGLSERDLVDRLWLEIRDGRTTTWRGTPVREIIRALEWRISWHGWAQAAAAGLGAAILACGLIAMASVGSEFLQSLHF